MSLPKYLREVGALVAPDFGTPSRENGLGVVHLGPHVVATVSHQSVAQGFELFKMLWVFEGAAPVEGDHKAPFINGFEGQ